MAHYSVLRVGNLVTDEYVNVGIVAHDGNAIDYYLIRDTTRAVAFVGDWFLRHLWAEIAEDLRRIQDYQDVIELLRWVKCWSHSNSIQWTPWRYTIDPTYRFCEEYAPMFLTEGNLQRKGGLIGII